MKPAPFNYLRPGNLREALELLRRHQGDAKILAGGQSLVPVLNFRLSRFDYLVDINKLSELSYIRIEGAELRIGAITRYRALETSPVVQAHAPLLATAIRHIAHLPIRTRGTIGGSLSHADPAAELPAVLVALQGTVVAESMAGRREIQAKDFFQGLFTTALAPDDLLVEVRFPVARPGQGFGFAEYAQRPGDLAIAGVAASVELGSDRVVAARLAAFGLDGSPQRLRAAEDTLIGGALTAASIERAARAAAEAKTQSDLRATAAMRTHLIQLLTERALIQAFENRKDVS